jgi:hypothetical protein
VVAANARKLKTGAKIAANKESYKAIGLFEDAVFPQVKNRCGRLTLSGFSTLKGFIKIPKPAPI